MFFNRAKSSQALILTDERLRNVQRVLDYRAIFDYFESRYFVIDLTRMSAASKESKAAFLNWAWPQMSQITLLGCKAENVPACKNVSLLKTNSSRKKRFGKT